MKIPRRYVPRGLTRKDADTQRRMIVQSRKQYRKHQFRTRKRVASFRNRPSPHVETARRMYGVESVAPSSELATATGCSVEALREIVRKGEGAYFSSGSRPNQTPHSWGIARLASAITAGKAAFVDRDVLERGCRPGSRALRLTQTVRRRRRRFI